VAPFFLDYPVYGPDGLLNSDELDFFPKGMHTQFQRAVRPKVFNFIFSADMPLYLGNSEVQYIY